MPWNSGSSCEGGSAGEWGGLMEGARKFKGQVVARRHDYFSNQGKIRTDGEEKQKGKRGGNPEGAKGTIYQNKEEAGKMGGSDFSRRKKKRGAKAPCLSCRQKKGCERWCCAKGCERKSTQSSEGGAKGQGSGPVRGRKKNRDSEKKEVS